jgi:hypothetical protein
LPRAIRRAVALEPGLPLERLIDQAEEIIDAIGLIPIDRPLLLAAGALAENRRSERSTRSTSRPPSTRVRWTRSSPTTDDRRRPRGWPAYEPRSPAPEPSRVCQFDAPSRRPRSAREGSPLQPARVLRQRARVSMESAVRPSSMATITTRSSASR